ncbi:MAG TPA: transglutaminase family protein [Verrucomicrobiae bacterium]
MIYQLTHTTTYDYLEPVSLSHHILRLRPRELAYQNCFAHAFAIEPSPKRFGAHTDYYGNRASFVEVAEPHTQLVIRSLSKVRRKVITLASPHETPAWEHIRDLSRGIQLGAALEASEFLFDSPLISSAEKFADYASPSFPKGRPILDAVLHLTHRIHQDFTFDPEATAVTTSVETVMKTRRGVCQDFAHLQIACLRSLGLPARYVSGYIETLPAPGKEKLVGSDASHAWVSVYCHAHGWIDVDPTNNLLVSARHVTLGWGRDYSDVSPVRGVILGSGDHTVKVAVDLQPLPYDGTSPLRAVIE